MIVSLSGTAPKIRKNAIRFALLAGIFVPVPAAAGPWTLEQGKTYNKPAINFFSSDSFHGEEQEGFEEFEDTNFTFYNETGITDDLSLIISVPFKDISRRDRDAAGAALTNSTSGIGDIDIGLRYNLSKGPVVVAVQGLFKAPYAYNENNVLPLGNGQEDFEGRFQLGHSLGKAGYVVAEAGYRYRVGAPSDEFRYLLEYGVDASKSVYLRAKLDGILSINNDSPTAAENGNPAIPLAFDLAKLELTAGYKISKKLAIEFTGTPTVYGNNSLKGTNYQLALVLAL